jgi:hypothetical protein
LSVAISLDSTWKRTPIVEPKPVFHPQVQQTMNLNDFMNMPYPTLKIMYDCIVFSKPRLNNGVAMPKERIYFIQKKNYFENGARALDDLPEDKYGKSCSIRSALQRNNSMVIWIVDSKGSKLELSPYFTTDIPMQDRI